MIVNSNEDYKALAEDIAYWIRCYAEQHNIKSLVVGVSGGVDSAVVSTLCAMSGLETIPCSIDIDSTQKHLDIAWKHISWLEDTYKNCSAETIDLSATLNELIQEIDESNNHAIANTKSRLRMTALYHIATCTQGIVVGTGNKVEDFGVGFFTKYGDGGVDISPIADLMKSQVREMGRQLGISREITEAVPTDGLWADGRCDEDQLGATYDELEWAMTYCRTCEEQAVLSDRQQEVLKIYEKWHKKSLHKIQPILVYPVKYIPLKNNIRI